MVFLKAPSDSPEGGEKKCFDYFFSYSKYSAMFTDVILKPPLLEGVCLPAAATVYPQILFSEKQNNKKYKTRNNEQEIAF